MTVIINGTNGITSVNGTAAAPSVTGTDTDTGIVYGTNTLSLATGGTTAMTIDSSQGTNFAKPIGLTVTPSAPGFPFNNAVIQSPTYTAYSWTSNGSLYLQTNAYYSGGWKYQQAAINPTQVTISGGFDVGSSATGSADAAITWTSMLGVSGLGKTVYLQGGTQNLAGTGITFPATQNASTDANTLDDYEEGTWTPSFLGTGSNPTVTYNAAQGGTYTKIGRLVVAQCYFRFTSFTGGSGAAVIGGLPFASSVSNLNGVLSASEWSASFPSSATYPYISGESNGSGPGTFIYLIRSGPGVAGVNIQVSNFTSTDTYLLFTFSYFT